MDNCLCLSIPFKNLHQTIYWPRYPPPKNNDVFWDEWLAVIIMQMINNNQAFLQWMLAEFSQPTYIIFGWLVHQSKENTNRVKDCKSWLLSDALTKAFTSLPHGLTCGLKHYSKMYCRCLSQMIKVFLPSTKRYTSCINQSSAVKT